MFVNTDLESILSHLNKLQADTKPKWGNMTAQHMVEHLTDVLNIALEINRIEQIISEDKVEKMQAFLLTDKPMAQNIEVPFVIPNAPLRNEELELAVDEFIETYLTFEEFFESNPGKKTLHPYYGKLNHEQWNLLNKKHFSHHFTQFDLV